ncbi:LysR family transcriptional regulator [Bacillus sp. Marseille-P3661]|uniref:LysR family transcriptional regulator n=1 Tax=Bacillus sp. Marseille-P3661 TaxID=1936234 RepID=UPI000C83F52F|nr:LysR family transcriptional regulator [Bacillus sp. Marseille-P3661]
MDEKDWDILTTIYEEKNITKAAQRLYTSQPALTYRINQLEKEFKIKIFVRGKRFIKFTAEGEHLAKYAQKMNSELMKLKNRIQDIKGSISGELRIGASSNFALYELPEILKRFHTEYPKVQFKIHTGLNTSIIKSLEEEKDHISIIGGDIDWKDSKLFLKENRICIISKEPINLNDLPDLPRITFSLDPTAKNTDKSWWEENYSRPPLIRMEVDKVETCKEMVLKGLGYGIVPKYAIEREEDINNLYILPLTHKDGTYISRNICAYYYKDDLELSTVKAFINFLKDYYSTTQ